MWSGCEVYGSSWFGSVYASCCCSGFQGADSDAEQLSLTEHLFDAALGELSVVFSGTALFISWGFQRRAHQNPLPGKRDFGWALG